jgi:hypothetical protein
MSTSDVVKQLHDKATRGIMLSTSEQAQLDAWYTQQDHEEGVLLTQTSPPQELVVLQAQVDSAIAQMLAVTQRAQELEKHNEALRRDIAALQQQLRRSSSVRSA